MVILRVLLGSKRCFVGVLGAPPSRKQALTSHLHMTDTLDFTILDSGSQERVVALARSGSDLAIARIPCGNELKQLIDFRQRIDRALRRMEKYPRVQELTDYGHRLFSFCVRDDLERLYNRLPANHVRMHIFSDRTEIQALPWEYMQDPNRVPGPQRERSVVRIIPTIGREAPAPLAFGQKVRVLFVSADPVDQETVSWPELKESIERTFAARLPADRFTLEAIEGATRTGLAQMISQRQFDIFHFSGHGEVRNGTGCLILTDRRTNKSSGLKAEELGVILSNRGIRLVVLSACESSAGNFADDFAVTAAALVRCGIPAVVANQLPVPDQTVATFVGALYEKLLECGDIDLAITEGRIRLAIDLATSADDAVLEWGIPTLYRHIAGAKVFQQ